MDLILGIEIMEKIKANTFKKLESNSIDLKDVFGALGGPTTLATEKATGWISTDTEPDTQVVSDSSHQISSNSIRNMK